MGLVVNLKTLGTKDSAMAAPEKPDKTIVIAMSAIACVAMVLATILIMAGRSISDLLAIVAVAAVPVLTAFIARIHSRVEENNKLANGNLTAERERSDRYANLAAQLALAVAPDSKNAPQVPPADNEAA